ncbi:P-loop containing nucleoside triphosphate hydrolase protein [Nemania diffusa]|nr:P-loop containing nucleoside triphosphate hydrolase protein [Nemania diffusa]
MVSKRKADDFIYTLSDNDDIPDEEVTEPNPPKKKTKKSKKGAPADDDAEEHGIWGKKEEDDGAMDSDFEFVEDKTTDFRTEDFEGWGFDSARKAMTGAAQKKAVDVDEIVRRRRGDKGQAAEPESELVEEDSDLEEEEEEDEEEAEDIDLDDEVLAEDGFGMGAASDDESGDEPAGEDGEEEEEEGDEDVEEDDDAASDNDSVATPVDHPEDMDQSDATDAEEDPEEAAKREAFFAPEDKKTSGKPNGKSSFQTMSLSRPILRGLNAVGFNTPTPIQAKTIPLALEGRDLVGGAVTGSGKTAAFVVPILERLLYRPNKIPTSRVVILAPTRELAIQCHSVATKLASHTDIKFCLAVGGLSLKVQEAELRLRPDVIIATPGRFIDHMRNSPSFATDTIEILVLDEADRMLEDGFADELNEILTTLPKSRQTMLFSATMTSTVDRLIRAGLNKPVRVMVDSQKKTVDKLEQKFVRLRPGREEKRMGYLIHICKTMHTERVIIFFRQKKDAHRARIIFALFNLSCAELHGSMNQTQRIESVEAFRDGKVNFLLATDLASRGLDIKGVDTVINYEGPQTLEIYVHRVGRTARAGRSGVAVTLAAEPDRKVVKAVVKAGKAQGAKITSLIIEPADADGWHDRIEALADEIAAVAQEEKEEKQIAMAEMQIRKGENMVRHEDEIKARPKRTWFETQADKKAARDAGFNELNGLREALKKKGGGTLSGKDKKKLDARAARKEDAQGKGERVWKKGAAERAGKGAVLNFKKDRNSAKVKAKDGVKKNVGAGAKAKGPARGKGGKSGGKRR